VASTRASPPPLLWRGNVCDVATACTSAEAGRDLKHQPTFVVCCPRSGSTWLRLLLDSHPDIACGNETFLFTDSAGIGNVIRAYRGELGFRGLTRYVSEDELFTFLRDFSDRCFETYLARRKKKFLVEKSVDHALHLDTVARVYPGAKIVHLIRDGRDVACSLLDAAAHWQPSWPTTIRDAARLWKRYNLAVTDGLARRQPDSSLRVHYEGLLLDTAAELRRTFAFIGAEALDDATITSIVDANRFDVLRARHASWREGRFFRYGASGDWINRFSANDDRDFNEEAGDLLADFGYSRRPGKMQAYSS